jgi:gamma-glutamyltranspeptidase/glutathione hydrolase
VDAAVAVSMALNVTEPCSCGIGGDAFALFYNAKTKEVKALNGSGRSPKALSIQRLREQGVVGKSIPVTNINSVTVPGEQLFEDLWI